MSAQAASSLGATPAKFVDVKVARGGSTDISLKLYNTGTSDLRYMLSTDSEFSSWVTFEESDFILGPNTTRDIKITIHPPSSGSDEDRLMLYVEGTAPSAGGTPVGGGLKIPVELTLTDPIGWGNLLLYGLPILPILVLIVAYIIYRKSKKVKK